METEVFVARQPILDRGGVAVGQELLFRDTRSAAANIRDGFTCTAAVVEQVLGTFGLDQILGWGDGFLNCTDEFLFSDFIDVLPPSRFVLEVLEDAELTPELGARCDILRQAGFRIALDDVRSITPALEQFFPHVDIVKLDWPYIAADQLEDIVASCRRAGKLVLAEKVEERGEHAGAMHAGCDLFQGFYFARPQVLVARKTPASFGAVFRVLQLLIEDASDVRLEQALKGAPALVIQLLRLANSGSRTQSRNAPIASVGQALSCVGTRQLMRWCCLVLYGNSPDSSPQRDPLVRLVERRAGFMEQAARELKPSDGNFCQAAWLSGLLSLAFVPHGIDLEVFIRDLPVDTEIQRAIIGHDGELGTLLSIAEYLEEGRFDAALEQARASDSGFAKKLPSLAL